MIKETKNADNIVKMANTTYSTRSIDKVSNGVYVRTYTDEEIQANKHIAKQSKQFYKIKDILFYILKKMKLKKILIKLKQI